jgi:hypothetical protein
MNKYIKVFEYFEKAEIKDLKAGSSGNWNSIRDHIQSLKSFTIINFKDREGYLEFLTDCKDDVVKQSYYTGFGNGVKKCPSVFINRKLKINDDDFEKYNLINYLVGKDNKPNILVKSKKESNVIGNEVVSTLSQNEVYPEDHFKIDSVFYKFINFFS